MAFRDFLMNAPSMFLVLGERIGVIQHIVSFWQYRFPQMTDLVAPTEEIVDILQDFSQNLETFEPTFDHKRPAPRRRRSFAPVDDGDSPYVARIPGGG